VDERVHAGLADVLVVAEVPRRREVGAGVPALRRPAPQVVLDRVDALGGEVGVAPEVVGVVEQG
jgi:hypothetical protein